MSQKNYIYTSKSVIRREEIHGKKLENGLYTVMKTEYEHSTSI